MSNIDPIIRAYSDDQRVQQILSILPAEGPQAVACDGLIGASLCFVLDSISRQANCPILYIATDKEEAAYLFNSFQAIRSNRQIYFLPDSYSKPTAFGEPSRSNILHRTNAIAKWSAKPAGGILISYPEAVFEQVVAPEVLQKDRLELKKSETMDVNFAIDLLMEYGYERTDFVYEPGQFSIRGGIVDIFSFGHGWPYRIELFDDTIEDIRSFDPLTQLSKKNLAEVSIIPNVQNAFDKAQKVSLTKVFPSNTLLCIHRYADFDERIHFVAEQYDNFLNSTDFVTMDESIQIHHKNSTVDTPRHWLGALQKFDCLYIQSSQLPTVVNQRINFNVKPQPGFNKNFVLLIENLQKNTKAGWTNYIFTANHKQIKRFEHIFEDMQSKVDFVPVALDIHQGFVDPYNKIACYTDHQIFERFHRYKLNRGFSKDRAINLKMLRELKPGDFVTHIDHGIGRYSGLEKIEINGRIQESVRIVYKNNDLLYVSINSLHKISKYSGSEGRVPALSKIGSDQWKKLKQKTKRKIKDIAHELIKLYAQRKSTKGFAFPPDGYLQNELEASFIYEDTPDQITATEDVKADMMKPYPMDRLICGDVGFGKTEIAIRAAFKCVVGGKQVAILVPTTILALQHFHTFKERLENFGLSVDYVNRFKTAKQKREIFDQLATGQLDLVIGTHAILNKKIKFKDLGLLIIDEEQKFGVVAKERLKNLKVNVDTLTLTATPIPRTLQFSLMAARDLSIIRTPPPNRQPIYTERRTLDHELIKDAIYYEVQRGGQVFFVHNRVKSLPDICAMVQKLCPDVSVAMAHGQMESSTLEQTLVQFIDRKYEVLVCTNIIETGLDISNANTIIINNAHQFGLSDLHQLRGRVGRSNKRAFCYLLTPPLSVLTPEARKRIRTIEEFSDLGSGFEIAMKDMDIRGAGNLLGAEQSGFINDMGYQTYQRILEEAIIELKENEYKELFAEENKKERIYVKDVEIDTDLEMIIPDDYVSVIQERLRLYTELSHIETEEQLQTFKANLEDRFGPLPPVVNRLFQGVRLHWIAKKLGLTKIVLKNNHFKGFFVNNPQSSFYESKTFQNILSYVNAHETERKMRFKQTQKHLILIIDEVNSMARLLSLLHDMHQSPTN